MRQKQSIRNCAFFIFCVLSFTGRSLSDDSINNITCKSKASSLPNVNHQKNIKVRCPANCQLSKCRVTGTSVYTSFSGVCCAGIHAGILSANSGGILNVDIDHYGGRNYVGSTSNGVTSQEYSLSWHLDFTVSGESQPLAEPRVEISRNTSNPTGLSTTKSKPTKLKKSEASQNGITCPEGQVLIEKVGCSSCVENYFYFPDELICNKCPNGYCNPANSTRTQCQQCKVSEEIVSKASTTITSTTPLTTQAVTTTQSDSFIGRLFTTAQRKATDMHTGNVPISEKPGKLPENHQESNETVEIGQQTVFIIIGCSVGLAALIFVVAFVSYKRQHKIRNPEPCVCYVNSADTSRQGLLNDPQTCDRVCVVREKMCADCDDGCPGSTYSF